MNHLYMNEHPVQIMCNVHCTMYNCTLHNVQFTIVQSTCTCMPYNFIKIYNDKRYNLWLLVKMYMQLYEYECCNLLSNNNTNITYKSCINMNVCFYHELD